MKTIPAQDIKRHGISVLDQQLADGPVHVIKNNRPKYVVLTEERYQEFRELENESYLSRVKASLQDVKAKKISKGTAQQLIKELGLDE